MFAYIRNKKVEHISVNSDEVFNGCEGVIEIPEDVEVNLGYLWDGEEFSAPPAPVPVYPSAISPVTFKLLFTAPERIALKALKGTDAVIADLFDLLDDPRLTHVNLQLTTNQQAVQYCFSKLVNEGVVAEADAPARIAAVLSGELN